jgi:hypothetical protein
MFRTYLVFGIATAEIAMGALPPASLTESFCVHPPHVSHPNDAYGYPIHCNDLYGWCKVCFHVVKSRETK